MIWLRTKARRDRWREEVKLLKEELLWTKLFFQRQAQLWSARAYQEIQADVPRRGYVAYARRQEHVWETLGNGAENARSSIL